MLLFNSLQYGSLFVLHILWVLINAQWHVSIITVHTGQFHLCLAIHLSSPSAWNSGNHWLFFTVSIVLPFLKCHVFGIVLSVAFSDWLLSLSNLHLKFLHFFYHWIIFHWRAVPQSAYPFTYWRTSWLFPVLDDYE